MPPPRASSKSRQQITALDDDRRALEERLAVTAQRLIEQALAIDEADARLSEAKVQYRERIIGVYKRGSYDVLALLLSSDTLTELASRMALLTRIVEEDSRVVADLNIAAADARYQQTVMAELQAQDRALEQAQSERIASATTLLAEQEALVAQLTVEAREALLQARKLTASTRLQWRAASIPIGTEIPRSVATVDCHPVIPYVISGYMPRYYLSTGQTFPAVCSWYGPGFNGRGTASGQIFNEDDFTCASRTLPFGTVLALTRGDRRIIVYVNDRGPYIDGRDLDLSKAAASALGFGGVATDARRRSSSLPDDGAAAGVMPDGCGRYGASESETWISDTIFGSPELRRVRRGSRARCRNANPGDRRAHLLGEHGLGRGSAAGRKHVIHDEHHVASANASVCTSSESEPYSSA